MTPCEILKKACNRYGQREVARRIGYSATTVNQVCKGIYPKPDPVLNAAAGVFSDFSSTDVVCPILGTIHENVCARYRGWALAGKVHQDRLYRQVKEACMTCMKGVKKDG